MTNAKLFELGEVAMYADWINLMTYDFAGDLGSDDRHERAELRKSGPGVQTSIANYLHGGRAPPRSSCSAWRPTGTRSPGVETAKPKSPHKGPRPKPRCTGEPGRLPTSRSTELLKSGQLKRYWDDETLTPYAYDPKTKMWVTYDDAESFKKKLDFLQDNEARGRHVLGDRPGRLQGGYPLISHTSRTGLLKK